jgi:hypothetical protein
VAAEVYDGRIKFGDVAHCVIDADCPARLEAQPAYRHACKFALNLSALAWQVKPTRVARVGREE